MSPSARSSDGVTIEDRDGFNARLVETIERLAAGR